MRVEETISLRDLAYYGIPRVTEYITLVDDVSGKKYHQTVVIIDMTYTKSGQMEHYKPSGTNVDISL
jgi:hypothetical protein